MLDCKVKIKNIKSGSLYEYDLGTREAYDYNYAMYNNSLLLQYLLNNGLKVNKKFTEDIICIDFAYGSRDYEEEVLHLENLIKNGNSEDRIEKLKGFLENVHLNKNKYNKLSKEEIRTLFYKNGISIKYKNKTIKYKMLYRSSGKAKMGSCIFINENLYEKAYNFIYMDTKMPTDNAPIVEISGYISLIASSIVDTIQINPNNILILKDIDKYFNTNVISVETDEHKNCITKHITNYDLKNTLFDGQALIDSSIFPYWGKGYILLRQHMTKMAAFKTHIQDFFKEYYKDNYETATIEDMFGNKHLVKDIKLITTDNAVKWLKFNIPYNHWCQKVNECDNLFGIVKTAHESKLGEYQRMSYQMINSLNLNTMSEACKDTVEYIESLKKDDVMFLEFLERNSNFSNDYEVLIKLCEHNREFTRSDHYRERKKEILRTYINNIKSGKLIQEADNLTIVGSPYAMLLYSVGEDVEQDTTLKQEYGTIQCFTERFKDGEYLCGFRSPFNSCNNMSYLHNVYDDKLFKFFDFGKCVIAVNMIGTDFQDRNNGSDMDSDFLYTTNNSSIVSHAKYCYLNYPTIVNNVPKEKNNYSSSMEDYARVDNNLSASRIAIGSSSNLAQLCLTYTYNFNDQKYLEYACTLSVVAQIAIDSAKRKFDIDINKEISRIKKDMNIKENGYPLFWKYIKSNFNENKINYKLKCPMNYLCKLKFKEFKPEDNTLPLKYFFQSYKLEEHTRKSTKVENLIEKYSLKIYNDTFKNDEDLDYALLHENFEELINDIKTTYISNNYLGLISWLINRAFLITKGVRGKSKEINCNTNKNKTVLLKVLYTINPEAVLKCFSKNLVDNI